MNEEDSDALTVSTHSRLKAAGDFTFFIFVKHSVSTHSRLKAAGMMLASRRFSV